MKKILTMLPVLLLSFATVISLASCDIISGLFGGINDDENTEGSSEGLQFILQEVSYMVSIGSCTDSEIVIPDTYNGAPVTDIFDFSGCDFITDIKIPASVFNVYANAFEGCTKLIKKEGGVHYVDNWVVGCDSDATEIKLREGTVGIAQRAFVNCTSLKKIDMPDSLLHVYDSAFSGCSSLVETVDGINYVGNIAISVNESKEKLAFREGTVAIASGLFGYCNEVKIPDSVKIIGADVRFPECEKIHIGSGVEYIGFYSLAGVYSTKEITVADSNKYYKSIDGNLYTKDGKALLRYAVGKTAASFTVPEHVTVIDNYAFFGCAALESATIGDGVTHIGSFTFAECTKLKKISVSKNVISIANWSFVMCESLTAIEVDSENSNYKSIDGILYSKDGKTLLQYPMGKSDTSFTVSDSVTDIFSYAFSMCYNLENVKIGKNVKSIGDGAFSYCNSLKNIVIPDSVTEIGASAFSECTSLESVAIGDGAVNIGIYAFGWCYNLKSINLGKSVTNIGEDAFYLCDSVTQLGLNPDNKSFILNEGCIYTKDGKTLIVKLSGAEESGPNNKDEGNTGTGGDNWWDAIKYDETELIMMMTHCSNDQTLLTGCDKYLAGEGGEVVGDTIDQLVAKRNANAYKNTKVNLTYSYYPDIAELYGFSKMHDVIFEEIMCTNSKTPDIYSNWTSDLLVVSLKGGFANLFSKKYGQDDYIGKNYLFLANDGYMADLMGSTTLSTKKLYLLASDYFIDIIRSEYVIPMNISIYKEIADTDLYPAGTFIDVNTLMNEVKPCDCSGYNSAADCYYECPHGSWTYDRLIEFSNAAYSKNGTSAAVGMEATLGFALADGSEMQAKALLYSSASIIKKEWNKDYNRYDFSYPAENEKLYNLFDKISLMFSEDGILCVKKSDSDSVGETSLLLGIRHKFISDTLLFGGIVPLGSLENEKYRDMMTRERGGFAILPVPVLNEGDKHSTQIGATGKMGAIRYNTEKFVQCSAFLHYQSVNSYDVLEEYYLNNFVHGESDEFVVTVNLEMLHFIRCNIRTALDATYEDAVESIFHSDDMDLQYSADRLHNLLAINGYKHDLYSSGKYVIYQAMKDNCLKELILDYEKLPS